MVVFIACHRNGRCDKDYQFQTPRTGESTLKDSLFMTVAFGLLLMKNVLVYVYK